MDRRNSKDKELRSISKPHTVTPDDGFIPEFDGVRFSQCTLCKNNQEPSKCKVYGMKPRRYQFVSSGLRCPQLKR